MKKTIAILLVLVIGMVGVWAENKTIEIYTNIVEESIFAISAFNAADTTNLGKLISTSTWTSTAINKSVTDAPEDIAWLNVKTNSATGFKIAILGTRLINTTVADIPANGETPAIPGQAANPTAEPIDYTMTVSVGPGLVSDPTFTTGSTATTAVNIATVSAVNALSIYNYKLNVDLDNSDYANAASGLYTADITVTFTAT